MPPRNWSWRNSHLSSSNPPRWTSMMSQHNVSQLQTTTRQPLHFKRLTLLHFRLVELRTHIRFGVVLLLAKEILLGTSFHDRFICRTDLPKRRVFLGLLQPVAIIAHNWTSYYARKSKTVSNSPANAVGQNLYHHVIHSIVRVT